MHNFIGLINGPFSSTKSRFARLSRKLGYLIEPLGDVCSDKLEISLVGGEELRAGIRIKGVRHVDNFSDKGDDDDGCRRLYSSRWVDSTSSAPSDATVPRLWLHSRFFKDLVATLVNLCNPGCCLVGTNILRQPQLHE